MVNLIVNLSDLRSMGNYAQTTEHVYDGLSKLNLVTGLSALLKGWIHMEVI